MSLFDFDDYKAFLKLHISENSAQRGYITLLARAASCQKSYLSQVLKGHAHLTPEHAMGLALFWSLDDIESEFFIQLVNLGRTSFSPLKNKILMRLQSLREEKENLGRRFKQGALADDAAQQLYYSSWIMSALHVIVDIEKFRTVNEISTYLNLSENLVSKNLNVLEKLQLVKKQGGRWLPSGKSIHLPKESLFTIMNHQNWRGRALLNAQDTQPGSVHYTSVQSLSVADYEKVTHMIIKFLDEQRKIVGPSKEEQLACLTLDWFRV